MNCEYCNKEFGASRRNQKFCSLECRRHHQNEKNRLPAYEIERTCGRCRKTFKLVPKLGGGNRKYCSIECSYKARIDSNRNYASSNVKPKTLWKCQRCGADVDSSYRRLCDSCKVSRRTKPRDLWKCRDCGAELISPYHQFCDNCLMLHRILAPFPKKRQYGAS